MNVGINSLRQKSKNTRLYSCFGGWNRIIILILRSQFEEKKAKSYSYWSYPYWKHPMAFLNIFLSLLQPLFILLDFFPWEKTKLHLWDGNHLTAIIHCSQMLQSINANLVHLFESLMYIWRAQINVKEESPTNTARTFPAILKRSSWKD